MKGFKPMGRGMARGFHYPASMGFTGSTGSVTSVSGYTRRRFAAGGFVRQDTPRMKVERVGDAGRATVQRTEPSSNLDQQAGGRSPLRPGYSRGGRNWIKGAIKHPGALHRALDVPAGKKIPGKKLAQAARSDNPTMRRRANLAMTLKRMNKADGGSVRRSSSKSFVESLKDVPELFKELMRPKALPRGREPKHQDYRSGRMKRIDDYVDEAVGGRKPGYANGGRTSDQPRAVRADYAARVPVARSPIVETKKGMKAKARKAYDRVMTLGKAHGGSVSAREAKQIAERVVGTHVRYPAPKGHKGFEKLMNTPRR